MSKLDQNLQIDGRAPSFSELVGGLPQPRHPIAPAPARPGGPPGRCYLAGSNRTKEPARQSRFWGGGSWIVLPENPFVPG